MNSKMGRPTDAKKDNIIKVRADEKLIHMLAYCTKMISMSKSDVVRIAIEKYYNELREEDNK